VQATLTAEPPQRLGVDDAEVEAEFVAHLILPLNLERSRADDQHAPDAMANDQLLDHQPSLDGLAEADVVCDEEVHPRHLDRAHERVELVGLDRNAAAKRRLQGPDVGRRSGTPAHSVQERVQPFRFVKSSGFREFGAFVQPRPGFDLPYNLKVLAEPIVLHGCQRNEMLRWGGGGLERRRWKRAALDLRDDPAAGADLRNLADLGRAGVRLAFESGHFCSRDVRR
jgi:hypothetical protein